MAKNLLVYLNQKMLLRFRKYDPGCLSRISDPGSGFFPFLDTWVKKALVPSSVLRIRIRINMADPYPVVMKLKFSKPLFTS
jgi:hypothetical protein